MLLLLLLLMHRSSRRRGGSSCSRGRSSGGGSLGTLCRRRPSVAGTAALPPLRASTSSCSSTADPASSPVPPLRRGPLPRRRLPRHSPRRQLRGVPRGTEERLGGAARRVDLAARGVVQPAVVPDLPDVVEQRRGARLAPKASKRKRRGPPSRRGGPELGRDRTEIHRPLDDGAVVGEPQGLGVDGRGEEGGLGPLEGGGDDGEGPGERDRVRGLRWGRGGGGGGRGCRGEASSACAAVRTTSTTMRKGLSSAGGTVNAWNDAPGLNTIVKRTPRASNAV